jgi:hypothetical protein
MRMTGFNPAKSHTLSSRQTILRIPENKMITLGHDQSDQMSLRKNPPKCGPTHFLSKYLDNLYRGKK